VDHFIYSDQLATLIGCKPPFWRLLLKSPLKWWRFVSAPWSSCQFWLTDRSQHDRIFNTLTRYRVNPISEVYTFLVLAPLLPVIGMATHARLFIKEHLAPGRLGRRGARAARPA
jgi:hypothetical protein